MKNFILSGFLAFSCFLSNASGQQVDVEGDAFISGNMGVGTSTATSKLQVGDFSEEGQVFLTVGTASTSISGIKLRHANDDYGFTLESNDLHPTQGFNLRRHVGTSAGVSDLFIDLTGNVGIGITDPDTKLEIAGQIKITGGNPGANKVLVSDADGLATWAAAPSAPAATYAVGDFAQGGVVFWVNPTGTHGKVVSIYDMSRVTWSNVTSMEIGESAGSNINGAGNTVAIMSQSGHTKSAAQHCADLAYGGYDDWYLPAITELSQIYAARADINPTALSNGGEIFKEEVYLSSTEQTFHSVFGRNFDGSDPYIYKASPHFVRAVRSF